MVAHTALVPPADIQVNGDVLFENIANGESLKLTVPVATYKVAIVPTGESEPVVLGPLSLTVKGGAVNRVYAVGDPGKKTMNVAVHVIPTSSTGSDEPDDVNTGTGGQAVGISPAFLPVAHSLIRRLLAGAATATAVAVLAGCAAVPAEPGGQSRPDRDGPACGHLAGATGPRGPAGEERAGAVRAASAGAARRRPG